jgi:hypothetical protein
MLNLNITKIDPHDDFTIEIYLNNNHSFTFDIKPYLKGEGLKELRRITFFKQAKFKNDVLYWDKNIDFPLHCMDIPSCILSH